MGKVCVHSTPGGGKFEWVKLGELHLEKCVDKGYGPIGSCSGCDVICMFFKGRATRGAGGPGIGASCQIQLPQSYGTIDAFNFSTAEASQTADFDTVVWAFASGGYFGGSVSGQAKRYFVVGSDTRQISEDNVGYFNVTGTGGNYFDLDLAVSMWGGKLKF